MATISVEEFKKALNAFDEAIAFSESHQGETFEIARDACIRRFEFCIELAWKTSAKILGSTSTTAKPVLREMAQNKLIDDVQLWFNLIEARNKSSHTYDKEVAKEVFAVVKTFPNVGRSLLKALEQK